MYQVLESRLVEKTSNVMAKRHLRIRLRAVSLFSWSVEQNARDTQITTRVTEGASFIRRGSPLRSNPFTEEWCPFRRPPNSKSSHHFFCSYKVHRSIQENDPNKHLNNNFHYPFIYFNSRNAYPFRYVKPEKGTPFGQSLSFRPP